MSDVLQAKLLDTLTSFMKKDSIAIQNHRINGKRLSLYILQELGVLESTLPQHHQTAPTNVKLDTNTANVVVNSRYQNVVVRNYHTYTIQQLYPCALMHPALKYTFTNLRDLLESAINLRKQVTHPAHRQLLKLFVNYAYGMFYDNESTVGFYSEYDKEFFCKKLDSMYTSIINAQPHGVELVYADTDTYYFTGEYPNFAEIVKQHIDATSTHKQASSYMMVVGKKKVLFFNELIFANGITVLS